MMTNLSIAHILPKRVADIYLMRQRVLDLSKKLNCLCLSGGYIWSADIALAETFFKEMWESVHTGTFLLLTVRSHLKIDLPIST